jgi:hypothetical protein
LQPIPKVHLCGGLGPANWGMMIKLQWFHAIFTPRPVLAIRCCEENGLRWGPVWNNSKWHLAVRPASHQKFPPLPLFLVSAIEGKEAEVQIWAKTPWNFKHELFTCEIVIFRQGSIHVSPTAKHQNWQAGGWRQLVFPSLSPAGRAAKSFWAGPSWVKCTGPPNWWLNHLDAGPTWQIKAVNSRMCS